MVLLNFADVSGWNPANLNLTGLDGVFIKATEGIDSTNIHFQAQHDEVVNAGLVEAIYHFADGYDPIEEANWFMANNEHVDGQGQALDMEAGIFTKVADPVGWALTWLQHVENVSGNKPGIYMDESHLAGYDWGRVVQNNNWLWIAQWGGSNYPAIQQWDSWLFWQYADTNQTGGDSDYFNGDLPQVKKAFANANSSGTVTAKSYPTYVKDLSTNDIYGVNTDGTLVYLTFAIWTSLGSPAPVNVPELFNTYVQTPDLKIFGVDKTKALKYLTAEQYGALGKPKFVTIPKIFDGYVQDHNQNIYGAVLTKLTLDQYNALGQPQYSVVS